MPPEGQLRRYRILAAAVSAGFLAVFLLLLAFERTPLVHPYPHEHAFGTTGFMVLLSPCIAAWTIFLGYRCPDARVRRDVRVIGAMLLVWTLVALVKYTAQHDWLVEACWYLYYIPFGFIPVLFLDISVHLSPFDARPAFARGLRAAFVVAAALSLAVLTNGLHGAAFVLDRSNPFWDVEYSYGPVHTAVFVWNAVVYAACFVLSVCGSRARLHVVSAFLAVAATLGGLYSFLYMVRVSWFFSSNFALGYILFVMLILELCFDFGLIPSRLRGTEILAKLPLPLSVVDSSGRTVFASGSAEPLRAEVVERALSCGTAGGPSAGMARFRTFRMDGEADLVYRAYPLHGGVSVVSCDVSLINDERARLERRRAFLGRRLATLEHDHAAHLRLLSQMRERELYADVEASLHDAVTAIREIIKGLKGRAGAHEESRRHELMLVRLLVAYCKRKGSLVLASARDVEFDRDRLMLVLNELSGDARAAGIDCAVIADVRRMLPARLTNYVYDCAYACVYASFRMPGSVLAVYVRVPQEGDAELRMTVEPPAGAPAGWSEELVREIGRLSARIGHRIEEDDAEGRVSFKAAFAPDAEERP